ncbi:MAG: YkgJ family cysteine cluster protein [Acidobacteriota bacterium]
MADENPEEISRWVTGKGKFTISGSEIELEVTVPAEPIRPRRMLPIFQQLTNTIVDAAVRKVEAEGRTISCKAGCGACCRQLVPIAEMETFHLREVVESLPESRQAEIRKRFDDARERLESAGMLATLRQPTGMSLEDRRKFGLEYFKLGIACPFLEEESCSIHPQRPLSCREYLVTSPAENCAMPKNNIEGVELAEKVSTVVYTLDSELSAMAYRWVPMILALEWADAHNEDASKRLGTELFTEVVRRLTGK